MSEPCDPFAPIRDTDETTIGMVDASSKRRLDRAERGLGCLVVIAGASIGEKIVLARDRVVIGRNSESDIWLDDALVSRNHAEIVIHRNGSALLRDLNSRNGTLCNDERVAERVLKDGDLVWIGGTVFKYLAPDSAETEYLGAIADRARLDALTGLLNRHAFSDYLNRTFARCRNLHEPLTVIFLDVDHFKRVNDAWGHPAGDFVLRELAGLLKSSIRPTDLLARYGGEELAVLLPYTTAVEGVAVAERVRAKVASHRFTFNGQHIPVTISLGVADLEDHMDRADTLIHFADLALYEAKQQGRNRTICSPES